MAKTLPEERLEASCHCGGVKFHLLRLDSDTMKKYHASLCMCRSCRLCVGQPLTAWAVRIPLDRVVPNDGKPLDNSLFGTLRRYRSLECRSRDFCGTCGASIFSYTTGRESIVDVAVGILLRSIGGVRARSWLGWDVDDIYHGGDVVDENLLETVKENCWRLR